MMDRYWTGRMRWVLSLCLLAALPIGCGGASLPAISTIPQGPSATAPGAFEPHGHMTFEEIVELDTGTVPPAPDEPPEGGPDEQVAPPMPPMPQVTGGPSTTALQAGDADADLVVGNGFQALTQSFSIPPDTMGAVGPNHVMTMINDRVLIQDKLGNQIQPPVTLETFFAAVGGNEFDPRVIYDSIDDRWLACANRDPQAATSGVVFAISDDDDPTGAWTFYSFDLDPANLNWADFVSMGFNNTWITLTTDVIPIAPGPFVGTHMWIIDKASALAGGALTVTQLPAPCDGAFPVSAGGRRIKPAVTFDPGESTLYCCSSVYNPGSGGVNGTQYLRLTQITGTGGAPVFSVVPDTFGPFPGSGLFLAPTNFSVNGFGLFPPAPQMGSATGIDTGRALLSSEPAFRNGRLWLCHTGGIPAGGPTTRTGAFWYELEPALQLFGIPVVQSGVCDGGVVGGAGETIQQFLEDSTIVVTAGNLPGQSFTVSVNGTITSVTWQTTGGWPAGTVDVYSGAGNGGALLVSEAIGGGGGGVQVHNFAAPPAVSSGNVYTFYVPRPNVGLAGIRAQSGNVYAGGIMYNGGGTVGNTDMYFEVDIAPGPGAPTFYYYPSLAVNAQNDMCMGFARSNASLFVEGVVAGRDGTDAPGFLSPITVAKAGEAPYVQLDGNGRNRWGDYSATCVDPSDDKTLWSIQEYALAGGTWATWWTRHATAGPISMTSDLDYTIDSVGSTANQALDCSDPPAPPAVQAECTGAAGAPMIVNFSASAPSGAPFDVHLMIDGVTTQTQTAAGQIPGPSALAGNFNFNLPLGGPYLIEVRADGFGGDIDVCQVSVTVVDTTAPVIDPCPFDLLLECTSPAGAVGNYTAPGANDVCDASVTVTCLPPSGSTFPLGVTAVTCTATDDAGNMDSCMFNVTVQDTTPPTTSLAVARSIIWSPRSGMIDVAFSATAMDICDPNPTVEIAIYSSDAAGPDATWTPPDSFVSLRAERDDASVGRIYLVVLRATDAAGLVSAKCADVIVPGPLTTSGISALFATASGDAAACEAGNGALPAGYAVVLPFTVLP